MFLSFPGSRYLSGLWPVTINLVATFDRALAVTPNDAVCPGRQGIGLNWIRTQTVQPGQVAVQESAG